MDIKGLIRELGPIDITDLSAAILEQEDAVWTETSYRQEVFDVHRQTESIVLKFVELDNWPKFKIYEDSGWDHLSSVALPIMEEIIERAYPPGGTVMRAVAARLVAGGKIMPHVDSHPSFHRGHRIHVPITTNPRVRFMIDGRPHQLQPGQVYEINNQKRHSVMNKGQSDRITFIFDYIPPKELDRISESAPGTPGGRDNTWA